MEKPAQKQESYSRRTQEAGDVSFFDADLKICRSTT
jgi:hypothetical protein